MRTSRTRRRAVFRASAAAVIATALGLGVAPAVFADAVPVTVTAVRTDADGSVSVSLNTNDRPLWVQIRVRASTAPDAATLFTSDTDETYGRATTGPVRLPAGTAYGDYPVDVDFRLPGGTLQHWTAADHGTTGLLDYRKHASVTELTTDRTSTDYDHRTVVLSGKVRLLDPATGDTAAAPAGTHVRITLGYEDRRDESVLVDTDATGAFGDEVTAHDSLLYGSAIVADPAPGTTVGDDHFLPTVYASPAVYRISAAASRKVAHWHDTYTVSGSVQRLTDEGWVPFGGLPVETSAGPGSFRVFGTGVTAADGTFSYRATAMWTTTLYTHAQQSPYLQYTADDSNYLDVPTDGKITLPAFTIDKSATVKTTGRLIGRCRYQTLDLQYSPKPNGKTGWTTLAHTRTGGQPGTSCSYYMAAKGGRDGYYRVYHPETPRMLPVATAAYRLRRARTSRVALALTAAVDNASPADSASTADSASPVGIGHATTSAQEHGAFTVPVWSDDPADPVASVSAVIRDGDTPVGRPVALVRVAAEGTEQDVWRLAEDQPLKLTEDGGPMPHLGRYPIDITATDARGESVDRPGAGTLDFTLRPEFAAGTALAATVDYGHRDVTVKGRLFGLQPGSGDQVPLPGRQVDLYQNPYKGWQTYDPTILHVTTDAGGAYAATVRVDDEVEFLARFGEDSAEAHGDPVGWTVPVFGSTAVTVTGAADHTRVSAGKTFVVGGSVRQGLAAPATAPPLAGAPVVVTLNCGVAARAHELHTVADAAGHYAVTATADPECDGTWIAAADSPFLDRQTPAHGRVAFPDRSTVEVTAAAIAANRTVTVTGRLLRTYHRTQTFAGQNTFLWYSPDGKTGWIRLKGANTDARGAFRLVAPGRSNGYYQVRHTETDRLIASAGPAVRLTGIATRVVGETANSTRVRPNTVIRVSGTLRQYVSGAWRPYAWQRVHLYFQPKGRTAWTDKGVGTTNATGWVGYWPKVTGDGKWLIRYFGAAGHFDSEGTAAVYVEMR